MPLGVVAGAGGLRGVGRRSRRLRLRYGSTSSRSTSALTSRAISMKARAAGERCRSRCQTTAIARRGIFGRETDDPDALVAGRGHGEERQQGDAEAGGDETLEGAVVVRAERVVEVVAALP